MEKLKNVDLTDKQYINNEKIVITENIKKIPINKNTARPFHVYAIDIDLLKYNPDNGRISCEIMDHNFEKINNNDIEQMIIESDTVAFNKTLKNIEAYGQLEPGIVTYDGLVIDGNRRFTCLRKLYENTQNVKFKKFNAIILDNQISCNKKILKSLELNIQLKKEERVDYDRHNKIIDAYKNIEQDKMFTIDEWAKESGSNKSEIELYILIARVINEYLEFLNKPNNWKYAKAKKIDGPFEELAKFIKKQSNHNASDVFIERIKKIFYYWFVAHQEGDKTRLARNMLKMLNDESTLDKIELNIENDTNKIDTIINAYKNDDTDKDLNFIINQECDEQVKHLIKVFNDAEFSFTMSKDANKPYELITKSFNAMKAIDLSLFNELDFKEKDKIISMAKTIIDFLKNYIIK